MRLLFLTNLYPPHSQGGYEEWCHEVALTLRARQHEVLVLTSTHGSDQQSAEDPDWVRRELHLEMELASLRNGVQFFTKRRQREQENLATLRTYVQRFQPEAIVIWGMWNIVRSLPVLAEQLMADRVVYYMGDYWPTLPNQFEYYWQAPALHWYTQLPKQLLGFFAGRVLKGENRPQPRFARVLFPTAFMEAELAQRGTTVAQSNVIYGAADTRPYTQATDPKPQAQLAAQDEDSQAAHNADEPVRLLWVGRMRADKGTHLAIKALARVVNDYKLTQVQLTIIGTGETEYLTYIEYLIRRHRLQRYVTLLGAQPKEALPAHYANAQIFLFTSTWPEPFGRVVIEAMAAGAAVIGAAVGGTAEILHDNENALTFPANDETLLAAQIVRLLRAPQLRQQLATAGYHTAVEMFDMQRMATEIELYLQQMIRAADAQELLDGGKLIET